MKPDHDEAPLPDIYQTSAPSPDTTTLEGNSDTDVAVIGAGICGISCALHLREMGRHVTVLEAGKIGAGGSGRAFGLVLPHAKVSPDQMSKLFGPDAGSRLSITVASGPATVNELIARHGIDCGLTNGGWLLAAHADNARRALETGACSLQRQGAPVSLLEGEAAQEVIGSSYYSLAMLDRRALGLNPLAYVRGLARAAIRAGATIHTASRALSIAPRAKDWTVCTLAGNLTARQVMIATDAYTDNFWNGLRHTIVPVRAYQIVSEPITTAECRTILPQGCLLTDTRRLYGGVRLTADFRLQLSVDGPPFRLDGKAMRHKATERVLSLFPHIKEVRWAEEWSGWVGMTRDHVPHNYQLAPGIWTALGFNGRGIAMATLLGRDMARRLCGWSEHELAFPEKPLRPFPGYFLMQPTVSALVGWYRARDAIDLRTP